MSPVPLRRLATVGTLTIGWILACGPLGDDITEGGSKRIEGRGSQEVGGSHHTSTAGGATTASPSAKALGADLECEDDIDTPRGASCAIQRISCGETIQASTRGQKNHFGDDFYRSKFCTPRANSYEESPEAIYALTVPANMRADITLESPCSDLDLFSIRWGQSDRCPSVSTSTGECEGSTKGASDSIRIMSVGRDEEHLVWVDGKKGNTGNFALRVSCQPAR